MSKTEIPTNELVDGMIFSPDGGSTWFVCAGLDEEGQVKVYVNQFMRGVQAPWVHLPMPYGRTMTVVAAEGEDDPTKLFLMLGNVTLALRAAGVPSTMVDSLRQQIHEAGDFEPAKALLERTVVLSYII